MTITYNIAVFSFVIIISLNITLLVSIDADVSSHTFELTQSLNLARQEHIQKSCRHILIENPQLTNLNSENFDHILIDHKHKLLYCYVPKVACTNWKRILMVLGDKWNDTNILNIPANLAHSEGMFTNLSSVTLKERSYLIENYHKLIFVRNPFERLLSAYRNKLEGTMPSAKYFQSRVGKRIIKAFRENPSNSSLVYGDDVTFTEFIQFITSKDEEFYDVLYNEHWQAISNLCHPCYIKYTLVGKYETLVDDAILALHTINATHVPFPRNTRTSGTANKVNDYYSQLPLKLIRKLYKLYQNDFRIFNYNIENIIGFDLG